MVGIFLNIQYYAENEAIVSNKANGVLTPVVAMELPFLLKVHSNSFLWSFASFSLS